MNETPIPEPCGWHLVGIFAVENIKASLIAEVHGYLFVKKNRVQ